MGLFSTTPKKPPKPKNTADPNEYSLDDRLKKIQSRNQKLKEVMDFDNQPAPRPKKKENPQVR
jgi:hypothetical protein